MDVDHLVKRYRALAGSERTELNSVFSEVSVLQTQNVSVYWFIEVRGESTQVKAQRLVSL